LIDSFIQTNSRAPLQVHYYSEGLPTQHGYCVGGSRRSRITLISSNFSLIMKNFLRWETAIYVFLILQIWVCCFGPR